MPKCSRRRKQRISRRKADAVALEFRQFATRAETLNADERSVEAAIATEAPVPMFDWERWEQIPEVLLVSGAEHGAQVPLLDSHARGSVDSQLGSIRNIRAEGQQLVGRLMFSSTAEAAWTKAREGHITDVSAGYQVLEKTYIPAGEKQTVRGRSFEGPINVVTRWRLREGSITPIGADEEAKLRGLKSHPQKGFHMDPKLRALCIERGMDSKLTDDEAQAWMLANLDKLSTKAASVNPPDKKPDEALTVERVAALIDEAVRKSNEQREAAQVKFRAEVDSLCDLADLPAERTACYALADIAKVREHLQAQKASRQVDLGGMVVTPGPAQLDKFRAAAETALVMRSLEAVSAKPEVIEKVYPAASRAKDAGQFRHTSLLDMARECLIADGINPRGLTRDEIAKAALGFPQHTSLGHRYGPAYHTTGSFPKITGATFNKSLQAGYGETPATWRGPMRQGMSVPDFKTINRVRMGAIPNLPVWPDNKKPEEASFADAQEPYAVEAYSEKVSFSWRLLVNDDMDALSRVPAMLGAAAGRTVNATAWAQITSNPLLGDGIAAFAAASGARKRTNLTTGAGAPSVSTLQTLTNLMMQMRGENTPEGNEGPDILALRPRYLVGPSALMTTILQLIMSTYDPANANMLYNTAAQLIPVIEPLLDTASTTAWYLFADPSQIDTVEVTFLQGQETPVTRNWMDEEYLSQHFAVLQSFGAKILNHRGIQKHAGA